MPFGGLLTAAIIGGSTIAGSAIGGSASARTSSATPIFTSGQQGIQNQLSSLLGGQLSNPSINLDPLQTAATGQINQNFQDLGTSEDQALTQRGFGRSGQVGLNQQKLDIARQGDLGTLTSQFAGYQINQENTDISNALKYAFADPGTTNVGAGSATASGLGAFAGLFGGGSSNVLGGIFGEGGALGGSAGGWGEGSLFGGG